MRVVRGEGTDRFTREDRLDQGGEFFSSEGAPDQTSAGWSAEVKKVGAIGILYKIFEDETEGVPPSNAGVVEAPAGFLSRVSVSPLRGDMFASSVWGVLGAVG